MENPRCPGTIMELVLGNKQVFSFISSLTSLLFPRAVPLE